MVEHIITENVKLIGWNVDPPRLVEILKHVFLPRKTSLVVHVYEPLTDTQAEILQTISLEAGKEHVFILFSAEGHSEQEYSNLLHALKNNVKFKLLENKNIILYTASFKLVTDEYRHVQNYSGILNNTFDISGRQMQYAPSTTKHFTFLNRLHRWERQRLLETLYEMNLLNYMNVSYLGTPKYTRYRELYPLVFDKTKVGFEDGYDLVGINSLFNVVAESSFENIGNLTSIDVPGITEKTYKTILIRQVPVFLSSMRTVYYYRLLGFDVFDDIVDHSYDLIENPDERIKAVANEVRRLITQYEDILALQSIRDTLDLRFKRNLQLMKWYSLPQSEYAAWYQKLTTMKII